MGKAQTHSYLIGPGITVFGGDPEHGSASGSIPPDTELRVKLNGFPRRFDIYTCVRVEEVKCLATDPKFVRGPSQISIGGGEVQIFPGINLFIRSDFIRHYQSTKLPQQAHQA